MEELTGKTRADGGSARGRIGYLDVFRGFGILLMVMGHVGFGVRFQYFIQAFHMPLFFMVSGFLFHPKSREEMPLSALIAKKARTLLLPYGVFGLAHFALAAAGDLAAGRQVSLSPLMHLLWVNTQGLPVCGALWFLTALFFTDLIVFLLERYIPNRGIKGLIVAVLSLTGNYANRIFPFTLPYALGPALVGVGLFYCGYLFRRGKARLSFPEKAPWIFPMAAGAVVTLLIFKSEYVDMRTGSYATVAMFWVNAILACLVGLRFSELLYPHICERPLGKWLMGLGRDSVTYVCLNEIVIVWAGKAMEAFAFPQPVRQTLILALSLTFLWLANKLFMETGLKILLGKK